MALVLEIQLDNKGAVKGVRQLKSEIGGLDKSTQTSSKKMSVSMLSIGTAIAATAVAAGAAALKFANMASAATETANKFNVIYKGVENVNTQIVEMSKKTGYASSTLQDMIASMGDLIKPAGFAADAAFDISKKIAQLSLDIGSFSNRNPAQVMQDFQSAIAGSMETLRKYGIDVSETSLAQEAFSLGLIKSVKEYGKLDAAKKRSIRIQALISKSYKDSKDAIGDLERTQDTYANRTRVLDEKMKEMGERLGTVVIPAFTFLATAATDALIAIQKMSNIELDSEKMARYEGQYKSVKALAEKILDLEEKRNAARKEGNLSAARMYQDMADNLAIEAGLDENIRKIVKDTTYFESVTAMSIKDTAKELEKILGIKKEESLVTDKIVTATEKINKAYKWKAEKQVLINEGEQEENAHLESILKLAKSINSEYGVADTKIKGLTLGAKKIEVSTNAWQIGTEKAAEGLTKAQIAADELGRTIKENIAEAIRSILFDTGSIQEKFENITEMIIQEGFKLGIKSILGFQHGGSFKVAGGGGQDSQLVAFRVTPGERVTVSPPGSTTNNSSMNVNLNFPNVSSVDEYTVRRVIIPLIQKEVANRGVKFA